MKRRFTYGVLLTASAGVLFSLVWMIFFFVQTGGVSVFGSSGSVVEIVDQASASIRVVNGSAGVMHVSMALAPIAFVSYVVLLYFAWQGAVRPGTK